MKSSDNNFFKLDDKQNDLVILQDEARKSLMRGIGCPRDSVKFVIKKISDILGHAIQEFHVPVPESQKNFN